jgi:hypothetical protein
MPDEERYLMLFLIFLVWLVGLVLGIMLGSHKDWIMRK